MRRVTIIATGGTIEKTYDEQAGKLVNRDSIVRTMLAQLRLEDTAVGILPLLHKDSLDLTDDDHALIVRTVRESIESLTNHNGHDPQPGSGHSGIVILHGTDKLETTGEILHRELADGLPIPVVLTGAMRPFEMKRSDALQNLTEAVFAAGSLEPGVYVVAHGRALRFPGPTKDRQRMTFVCGPNGGC